MVLREIRGEKKSKPKISLPKGDKKVFGHVPFGGVHFKSQNPTEHILYALIFDYNWIFLGKSNPLEWSVLLI